MKKIMFAMLTMALMLAVAAGCGSSAAAPAPTTAPVASRSNVPLDISVQDAAKLRDAGAFVLDVREPSEWQQVHIQGATLIPLGQLPSRVSEVPKDKEVVIICHSGNRSKKGRDVLVQAGFTNVTSVNGGMNAWSAAGLPTVSGQ